MKVLLPRLWNHGKHGDQHEDTCCEDDDIGIHLQKERPGGESRWSGTASGPAHQGAALNSTGITNYKSPHRLMSLPLTSGGGGVTRIGFNCSESAKITSAAPTQSYMGNKLHLDLGRPSPPAGGPSAYSTWTEA